MWTHSTWIWFECFFSCFGLMTLDQKWLRVAKLTLLDTGSSRETHQVSQLAVGGPSSDKMTRQRGMSIVRRLRPKMRKVVYANAISLARHEDMHDRSARKFYTISTSWFQPTALLYTHIIHYNSMIWKVECSSYQDPTAAGHSFAVELSRDPTRLAHLHRSFAVHEHQARESQKDWAVSLTRNALVS